MDHKDQLELGSIVYSYAVWLAFVWGLTNSNTYGFYRIISISSITFCNSVTYEKKNVILLGHGVLIIMSMM